MGGAGMNVVVVGAEFGAEFAPIYRDHPDVASVGVADLDRRLATDVARAFDLDQVYGSLAEVLGSPRVDAVHLVTGIPDHARQTLDSLAAGKHTACTVPMATSLAEMQQIVDLQASTGLAYMMMETAVFTREFFAAQEMFDRGDLGEIAFARGTHYQDMTSWPAYWRGLPPMFYSTHAISPILRILDARPTRVRALGSGVLREENRGAYSNTFPVESALVELADSPVVVELSRSLFQVARSYTESFSLYGDKASFEWAQLEDEEDPVAFEMSESVTDRGRAVTATRLRPRDRAELLPDSIRRYTQQFVYGEDETAHRSFIQGGGHGGSHPHLVNEFVASIREGREPSIGATTAARWTAVGVAAHQSALQGGTPVAIPDFAVTPSAAQ